MQKKETVIEKKPTFKNLINVEKERIPESKSRSKSKSNFKKKSRISKASTISPPKSVSSHRQISQASIPEQMAEEQPSHISPKQKRRTQKIQANEVMKKIINMKNKVILLEKNAKEEENSSYVQDKGTEEGKKEETIQNLKTISEFLSDYDSEVKRQVEQIKGSFLKKADEIKRINTEQISMQPRNFLKPKPGMPQLEAKMLALSQYLSS